MSTTLTLATLTKNAMLDALDGYIGATGTLVFATSGDVTVATLNLVNPPFETAASGAIDLDCNPDLSDTNAVGGTMAKFFIKTTGAVTAITGDVHTTTGAINFAGGLVVGVGDTVTLQTFAITMS